MVSSLHSVVAEAKLQELETNGDETKQKLYRLCRENGPGSHPLKPARPQIGSPSLLDRVQERPDVEGTLRQLRRQRLKDRGDIVYIHPQAKASLQALDEARFPLLEYVNEFLASDQMVFLLLGDSGAGKSTFNRELEYLYWQSYQKNRPIPLYINLPAIDKPEHDLIAKQLRKAEFTEPQIRELKQHRQFVLICDGYDESQQTRNLYTSNRLNQTGEWSAKMIISCRSEYLGVDYRDRFQPGDRNNHSDSPSLQEAVITPFSMDQVQDYIMQYVSIQRPLWGADDYMMALDLIPSLKELVKNPFMMSLSLDVLPRMVDPGQDLSATHITRMALYDQFIEHWLERGKKRLVEKKLSSQARAAFESLVDEGFTRNGIDYLKKLSVAIYKEQSGQPVVTYSRYKDENSWKALFFSREDEKQLLREACPLIRNGNQHRFIHRSLLEYGVALAIFDPREMKEAMVSESSSSRRMSVSSVTSFDGDGDAVEDTPATIEHGPDLTSPLVWRSFVNDPSVLQFLEERVQKEPLFKEQLLDYIEQSKNDKKWRTAASNAITILVRAGVQFVGADLRGIRVPNADLSYGMFYSAQLQGADLRNVDFRQASLRDADFSQAQMAGVQFGELPFLKTDGDVKFCVYAPDGTTISAGLDNGKIFVYSTSNWELLREFEGHRKDVESIVYSLDSQRIASGSQDNTVRLWDIITGECIHVLRGHLDHVKSVAYSPQGDQIVSAGNDKLLMVWDVQTGRCRHSLFGHTDYVKSVIYSPQGDQIASCSSDCTVRLWDADTKKCLHILRGHKKSVLSIAYSPRGDQVTSASDDETVRLWNATTGDCHHTFKGHTGFVYSVAYSPNGDQVASCGADRSVRLWDVKTGVCLHTLLGHSGTVNRVVYSPQGDLVASSGYDMTPRLWDSVTGVCRQTLTGHFLYVLCVAFSPKGDQVASGSEDMTIRLWDVGTKASRHISDDHVGLMSAIISSPSGDHVATCSHDKTARVWDAKTGICLQTFQGHSGPVNWVVFSPASDQIATCSSDTTVRLWDTATGECSHTLTGHNKSIFRIAYSPRGDQLASVGMDETLRLWDVNSGECRYELTGHSDAVSRVLYSPNGSQVATCGHDRKLLIWNAEAGVCNHILTGHTRRLKDIAYSPQGDQIASVSEDTMVRVWDVKTGECLQVLSGHNTMLYCVAYSPKGDQITSSDRLGTLKVWDLEAGTCLWTLTGHTDQVTKIVYPSRGDMLISVCDDKSVLLWDLESGQCRAVIRGFKGDIAWIESPIANYLVAGSLGVAGMWQVDTDEDQCRLTPHWMITKGELDACDATIQDVHGLSQLDSQLLKQRGAVGEPAHRLRDASKKLMTMASVVSKLKPSSDGTKEDPTFSSTSVDQLEKYLDQATDLVASIKSVMDRSTEHLGTVVNE